jgi:peptidoglycan/LPS O-acetylase OafA/YrhL
MSFGLRGIGTLATAVTVTLFYVLMVAIRRYRFDKQYGPVEHLLFAAALVRLVLISLPVNLWDSPVPPQPWSTIRNLPLLIQGLVAFLILRDARAKKDRAFWWVGIMILVSFACYMAVVLFVQQVPLIGMLMIPKTMTYIAVCLLFYNELYKAPPVERVPDDG